MGRGDAFGLQKNVEERAKRGKEKTPVCPAADWGEKKGREKEDAVQRESGQRGSSIWGFFFYFLKKEQYYLAAGEGRGSANTVSRGSGEWRTEREDF